MCTALGITTGGHYFGRTLDLDHSYGEEVCVMPRRVPLVLRGGGGSCRHYAMIGMATVRDGYPLFYDGVNEHGLAMAGLNFPGNAQYPAALPGEENVAAFELIPFILGQCKTCAEARRLLTRLRLVDTAYSDEMPPAPLHWMISAADGDLVAEATTEGMQVYDNPVGVLANNPPFCFQLSHLKSFDHLRTDNCGVILPDTTYSAYSQGLGAVGLPGDVSSMSRFVRAAFIRQNAVWDKEEDAAVGQFFHVLSAVEMVRGICRTEAGTLDYTLYTACMNCTRGLYYYTTYHNRRITCVEMHGSDLDGSNITRYPLLVREDIRYQN